MTVHIDGIRLNEDCFQAPPAPSTSRYPRHGDSPAPQAQCTGTFHFHVREGERVTSINQDIPFIRRGTSIVPDPAANDIANLQVSTYRLGEVLNQTNTQRLFTLATLVEGFTRDYTHHTLLSPDRDPRLNPRNNTSQAIQNLRGEILRESQDLSRTISNFILYGDLDHPDSVQLELLRSYLDLIFREGPASRSNLSAVMPAMVTCNHNSFGSTSSEVARSHALLNAFFISRRLHERVVSHLPEELKNRLKSFFIELNQHLFLGTPSLNELRASLRSLAWDLYRLAPQGNPPARINLYAVLQETLSGPIVNPNVCDVRANDSLQALETRPPFNVPTSPQTGRLRTLVGVLAASRDTLNENLLRYSTLSAPEAIFESVYDVLATPASRQTLVARITTNTQIVRPQHLSADWLAQNGNLREALEACLFDPSHPDRGAVILRTNAQGRVEAQLDVARLRTAVDQLTSTPTTNQQFQLRSNMLRANVGQLLASNLTNRREFQATVLALMYHLFGDRGQSSSIRAFVPRGDGNGEVTLVPLIIDEPTRGDLERFYEETIRDLGRRDAYTETLVPVVQGITCAAGGGLLLASGLTGEFGRNEFGPMAAGGGFGIGAGCAPLIDRAATGVPQNAYRRWATVGGPTGTGLAVLLGFLPMIISAAQGGDHPPGVMVNVNLGGRNPVTGYGQ